MIIYIYGSDSFKKEIHELLQHSNIKFRLDEHGEIIELKTLDELKKAIEDNPNNIYLIDDAKIIKKNSLNQKIKFLTPKDGIEQEYLLDNGIGDISVDSIDELSKHIIRKLEAVIHENESMQIQESIVEIVEDAYEQEENQDNNSVQLDDELSALLSNRDDDEDEFEEPIIEQIDDISAMIEEEKETQIVENNDSMQLKDLSFEEDSANIEVNEENNIEEINKGVDMADEFSEFDTLNEADIMAALDEINDVEVSNESMQESISSSPKQPQQSVDTTESLDLGSSNVDDIAKLISELLNNKTLEITVKVKN